MQIPVRRVLQLKACVPTAGAGTVRRGQGTTEARPCVYRHQDFALGNEETEAMEKILRDFIDRSWLEP